MAETFFTNEATSALDVFDITPNDTLKPLGNNAFRGFMVTVTGDVSIVTPQGKTVTIPSCQAGTQYGIGASIFRATGTTATGIKGLV